MFYIQLSEDKRLVRSECEKHMAENGRQSEPITLSNACKATRNYRHAIGLENYEPAIFIGLPTPTTMPVEQGTITIYGFWLFNAIKNDEIIYISVPAYLDNKNKYQPLLPPEGTDQNPMGLELREEKPCPPPPPCPEESVLTRDTLYNTRFGKP